MAKSTKHKAGSSAASPGAVRKRGGFVNFCQEVIRETKKVTWPTFKETWLTSLMVFIMVALTVVFFFCVDSVLAFGERLLIGAS